MDKNNVVSAEIVRQITRMVVEELQKQQRLERIAKLEKEMKEAAKMLEFELAAALRVQIILLRGEKKKCAASAPCSRAAPDGA